MEPRNDSALDSETAPTARVVAADQAHGLGESLAGRDREAPQVARDPRVAAHAPPYRWRRTLKQVDAERVAS